MPRRSREDRGQGVDWGPVRTIHRMRFLLGTGLVVLGFAAIIVVFRGSRTVAPPPAEPAKPPREVAVPTLAEFYDTEVWAPTPGIEVPREDLVGTFSVRGTEIAMDVRQQVASGAREKMSAWDEEDRSKVEDALGVLLRKAGEALAAEVGRTDARLTLGANGTFTWEAPFDFSERGTWTHDGDIVRLEPTPPPDADPEAERRIFKLRYRAGALSVTADPQELHSSLLLTRE